MIPAACLPRGQPRQLADGAKIWRVSGYCTYQTRFRVVQEMPLAYQVMVHNSCECNEWNALNERHLIKREVGFDLGFFRRHVRKFTEQYFHLPQVERMNLDDIIQGYSGAKRRRYKLAKLIIVEKHDNWRAMAAVQMFVKPDRHSVETIHSKAPRAIQYRHPAFNLMLARWLKPIEHYVYELKSQYDLYMVAKGKNNLERAQIIVDAAACFQNPVFVLADHSKFDSYVNEAHLRFLHGIYDGVFKDRFLRRLLKYQIFNRGYTKAGIHYKVKATRMSGDFDTGLGNTLLNLYIIHVVFRKCQGRFHVLLDGDDSVIVCDATDLSLVDFKDFEKCGFSTTYEVVSRLEDVEFCRAKLLPLDPPRFARCPVRALSNMSVSSNQFDYQGVRRYVAGLGVGEAAASNGVPIIGPIAYRMGCIDPNPIIDENIKYMYGASDDPIEITDEARLSFEQAYGWSPEVQQQIEKTYKPRIGVRSGDAYHSWPWGPGECHPH